MEYKLSAKWTEGIAFSTDIDGFEVMMDSNISEDPKGPSPKKLLLVSLMGCTGMDVVSLLQKMRVEYDRFEIQGVAPLTEEHPKVFERVDLHYIISGQNIKREKVEKAISLSQERYCGVSMMLKKHCPVDWTLEIRP